MKTENKTLECLIWVGRVDFFFFNFSFSFVVKKIYLLQTT